MREAEGAGVSAPARATNGARELPRGRHELTRAAVADSQRTRLLDAMAEVVAEKGYVAATVADVVAAAGVSRRTFYEQFEHKEACFLAAHRAGLELLLNEIRDAVTPLAREDWRGRARASIESYLRTLAERPSAAWAFTVEALGAGPHALEQRAQVLVRWVAQWRALHETARRQDQSLRSVSDDELAVLVGGIEELVRECMRSRSAQELPGLAPRITEVALATLGGGA
jgi:AcrR family transcriptional regulator